MMTMKVATLTPNDNSIVSKYAQDDVAVYFLCDATNGAFTVSLPDATMKHNQSLYFKKVDSTTNPVTIQGVNGQKIENGSNRVFSNQFDFVGLVSDSNNWWIVSSPAMVL